MLKDKCFQIVLASGIFQEINTIIPCQYGFLY